MIRALARKNEPDPSADAVALFERLSELSALAREAVELVDGEAVLRILAERARVMERADELVSRVMAEATVSGGESGRRAPPGVSGSLLEAARRLATADASLRVSIASQRDSLARDLNGLESGGVARSAYGGRQRARDTINVVR